MASKLARRSEWCHKSLQLPPAQQTTRYHPFSTAMDSIQRPIFATSDEARTNSIERSLRPLLLDGSGRWILTSDQKGISRKIQFKTFKQASNFMIRLIPKIADVRHHPTWTNTYNTVEMTWSTHRDKETKMAGISELDVLMAKASDQTAADCGEQTDQKEQ